MKMQPELRTARLVLRPFAASDAKDVQRLAGDHDIAAVTIAIPHPYEDGMAEAWIATHPLDFERDVAVNFAVTVQGTLIGAMGLRYEMQHKRAEMGYWIGKPFWHQGYATEAARALLAYGFRDAGLNKVYAHHMGCNPASGRVMQKIGMKYEGLMRQHVLKWGVYQDVHAYGALAPEWTLDESLGPSHPPQGAAA
jgi:ribosomal-protein-alanine N-acetyltransferase